MVSRTVGIVGLLAFTTVGSSKAQIAVTTRSAPVAIIGTPTILAGPPPASVSVTGTPARTHVTWVTVGAGSYTVERWLASNPECCRAKSPLLGSGETTWDDAGSVAGKYVYRVTALYLDGRQGFVDVNYLHPEPTNPATLTATIGIYVRVNYVLSLGVSSGWSVPTLLQWTEVPGAAYYMLWGPGLPTAGLQLNTIRNRNGGYTQQTSYAIPYINCDCTSRAWGLNTWTVGAFFLPGPLSTAATAFTKGSASIPEPPANAGAVWKPET